MRLCLRSLSLLLGAPALSCADAAPLLVADPGPAPPRVSSRVYGGRAAMLFDGPACTRELGARGDRWCGFVAGTSIGERSLYVVNVSAVRRGTPVTCDAPDASCLLLTSSFGGDLFDPTHHGTLFQGDTLTYYDETLTPYVWRPGMDAGRRLVEVSSARDATFCVAATRGTAVACLVLPATQDDPALARATIHSGKADGPTEPLLAPLDDVIAANTNDRIPRFGYFFPAVGSDLIAWTTREGAAGPELLRLARVDDPSSKVTIAADVHDPVVSPDGNAWHWLRAIDPTGIGTLQTARFPNGEDVTDLLPNTRDLAISPARGTVVARTSMAELFAVELRSGAPDAPRLLDTKVQDLLAATDTNYVAYAKHFAGMTQTDLFVQKVDGSATCVVNTTVSVRRQSLHFSPGSASAVWALAKGGGAFDGQHTHLSTCSTTPLAADVVALAWLGDDTIVFMDDFDPDALTGTMRYRKVTRTAHLDGGPAQAIAEHVDTYALADPDRSTLVYTVNGSDGADGVYVW